MASPPFSLYTNPGTPTFGSMTLKREPVVAGRFYLSYGQPTGVEPYRVIEITLEGSPPLGRVAAREKIEEFARMPGNWDGYGALQIKIETIQNALEVLEMLPNEIPMPDITPNPNGTLSFEWESSAGIAHLEIGRTRFSFYIKPQYSAQPVLRDWRVGDPNPHIGQLLITYLYTMERRTRFTTDAGYRVSSIPGRYFMPDNPDANLSIAS